MQIPNFNQIFFFLIIAVLTWLSMWLAYPFVFGFFHEHMATQHASNTTIVLISLVSLGLVITPQIAFTAWVERKKKSSLLTTSKAIFGVLTLFIFFGLQATFNLNGAGMRLNKNTKANSKPLKTTLLLPKNYKIGSLERRSLQIQQATEEHRKTLTIIQKRISSRKGGYATPAETKQVAELQQQLSNLQAEGKLLQLRIEDAYAKEEAKQAKLEAKAEKESQRNDKIGYFIGGFIETLTLIFSIMLRILRSEKKQKTKPVVSSPESTSPAPAPPALPEFWAQKKKYRPLIPFLAKPENERPTQKAMAEAVGVSDAMIRKLIKQWEAAGQPLPKS